MSARGAEHGLDAGEDLLGLGHAPDALFPLGELAFGRADELDPARAERCDVLLRRRMEPHARVHRRRDQHGAGMGENRLGEHVVGEAVRHARERVRRQRRDDEQIPAPEMRIRILARRPSRERREGLGRDEAPRGGGQDRFHLVPGPDEQANERAGLVGRNPAGDSEQDARHAPSLSRTG